MIDRPTPPGRDPGRPAETGAPDRRIGDALTADTDALDRLVLDALTVDAQGPDDRPDAQGPNDRPNDRPDDRPDEAVGDERAAAEGDRLALASAALAARPAGRALTGPAVPTRLVDAHREVATATVAFVRSLSADDLAEATWLAAPIGAVLAHLVGQLERVAELLDATVAGRAIPAAGDDYDHWHSTAAHRQRLDGASPTALADALAEVNDRIAGALTAAGGSDGLGSPGEPASPATMVLVKTFEMWMHADDARLALGHDVTAPSPGTVLALCDLATSLLPVGMAVSGNARPRRTVRVVLTGPGGGTWRCPGSPGEVPGGDDDALLVADAVTFCRLFHAQVSPDVVPLAVDGDGRLLDALLAGAQAFAERT